MILFSQVKSFSFDDIFEAVKAGQINSGLLTAAGILIFFGAVGKSAQFPLHTWLPDAMEGPTPVSALIHAATMVAAGVYLTARVFPILTPTASLLIAYIGGFTAIFAATIAIVRENIKRVLAYSTVSQLGYMMLGIGVGSYVSGLFHLTTHAFFKALLFLGSGSVIHAVHTEDMRLMGGLKNKMPLTFWTFLIATFSISGVPFIFSGFWSKDAILGATLAFVMEHPQHIFLFLMSATAAGITAFYMFRLVFMTFFGQPKDHHRYEHAHESPANMTIALVVLAILSFPIANKWWFEGLVKNPPRLAFENIGNRKQETGNRIEKTENQIVSSKVSKVFLVEHVQVQEESKLAGQEEAEEHKEHGPAHSIAMVLSIIIAGLGILLATMTYYWKKISAEAWAQKLKPIYKLLWNKYYIDEFYEGVIVKGIFMRLTGVSGWFDLKVIDGLVNLVGKFGELSSRISGWIDNTFVDGLVNAIAAITWSSGSRLRRMQTGSLQNYLLVIFIGIILFVMIFRAI
jgi:NADH-quinone oxidoreductase subunit L